MFVLFFNNVFFFLSWQFFLFWQFNLCGFRSCCFIFDNLSGFRSCCRRERIHVHGVYQPGIVPGKPGIVREFYKEPVKPGIVREFLEWHLEFYEQWSLWIYWFFFCQNMNFPICRYIEFSFILGGLFLDITEKIKFFENNTNSDISGRAGSPNPHPNCNP